MNDHDKRLDERLARAGAAWRDDLPHPRRIDPYAATNASMPRWAVPVVAAAMVAVLAAGGAVVLRGRSGHEPRPVASTSSLGPGAVVPWKPLPATHPTLPTSRVGAPPAAELASAPACRRGDLRLGKGPVGAAMGTVYIDVTIRPVGKPCTITGYPTIELLDRGAPVETRITHDPSGMQFHPPRVVLVTRKHPAAVRIGSSPDHACSRQVNTAIRVELPGGIATTTVPGFGRTGCWDQTIPEPWTVFVFRIQSGFHPHRVSPYDHVRVTGDVNLFGTAGSTLDFTVTLTSRDALVLDPCPDYAIWGAGPSEQPFGLNCAGVPYRDASGRPYLPAGVPVTFAMQVRAPAHSTSKLAWMLDSPTGWHGVSGTITIRGDARIGSLAGSVRVTGGGPATTVTAGIVVTHAAGRWYKSVIGRDGRYSMQLPPGRYEVTVRTPQWNGGAPFPTRVTVTGGAATSLDILLPRK